MTAYAATVVLSALGLAALVALAYNHLRCRHQWEVKDGQRYDSPWELMHRVGNQTPKSVMGWMFVCGYVSILACSRCGKLRIVKDSFTC